MTFIIGPRNIENYSDSGDCVKTHLIHLKKNCISKTEIINALPFQNADLVAGGICKVQGNFLESF